MTGRLLTVADSDNRPMTVPEAALALRLDVRTVRDMFQRGDLAGYQTGPHGAIRLSRESVLSLACGKRSIRARCTRRSA